MCDTDDDNDGTLDPQDGCPFDPNKVAPGVCGCGVPDADLDNDGVFTCFGDCNDNNPNVFPGALEINNGIDDNCNGLVDETISALNNALNFDGVNDYIEIPNNPAIDFCSNCPMTVEGWVYREGSNPIQHILGKRSGCNINNLFWQVAFDATGFGFCGAKQWSRRPDRLPYLANGTFCRCI
ncbi:MAG: putative metal-binding motif-containing protein [Saprospiraceae bacterium]|nr:putative metal-binding motif-containing protein [Saprospiraceae bacterium]